MHPTAYVLVNFGGPRTLKEVEPFLVALLGDKEVLRTPFPKWLHQWIFRYVAQRRALKLVLDYEKIGGKSPLFEDTEAIASAFASSTKTPVLTFHRYLTATHRSFFEQVKALTCGPIILFPMFPQFSYATTGSVATFFYRHLPHEIIQRMRWIKSYPQHPAYLHVLRIMISEALEAQGFAEDKTVLLFSAHGLPLPFITSGDPYLSECEATFHAIMKKFPKALGKLCFQSKFGPGEWIRPYTSDACASLAHWAPHHTNVMLIPLSFTSDHIETLYEMDELYIPLLRSTQRRVYRLPAMNRHPEWVKAIAQIAHEETPVTTQMLVRY